MTDSIRFAWRRLVNRDGALTHACRRVLLELESYADADGTNAHPGLARIARHLTTPAGRPISEKTVQRALETGCTAGYIRRTRRGHKGLHRNAADVYELTFPENTLDYPDQ